MSDIGVALVGAGPWGLVLSRALERAAGAPLRWVCELDADRRAGARGIHPAARLTASVDELLADPEVSAVAVAVDSAAHHSVGRRVLLAGRHLLLEKPMALSVDHATDLETLAREQARILTVGHLLLHHPAVARAREIVAAGELGDDLGFNAVRAVPGPPRSPGGCWWTLAPHDVSLALYLFDALPVAVRARAVTSAGADQDIVASATMSFADGRTARVEVSRFAAAKRRRFAIAGSRRSLEFDELEAAQPLWLRTSPRTGPTATPVRIGFEPADPLLAQCRHFLASAACGDASGGNAAHALDVVRVLEAGSQSMRLGGAAVKVVRDPSAEPVRKVA